MATNVIVGEVEVDREFPRMVIQGGGKAARDATLSENAARQFSFLADLPALNL